MTWVYKSKIFARFARKARISDADLWKAVRLAEDGGVDADLGGGVIKQRIARAGQGKSGGSRSIILFRKGDRAVFVYGFEKKDRSNIDTDDLLLFRNMAREILEYSVAEMEFAVEMGEFVKVVAPEEENRG